MLRLPTVTLVAVTGKNIPEHEWAMNLSSKNIEFGDKLLITKHFNSIDDWCKFIVFDLGHYIKTEHIILIHDDGYIINPDKWKNEWLQYDYAGSPFPLPTDNFSYRDINGKIQRVGNSVGLRSKKLLDLPKKIGMEWKPFHGFYNEDGYISVNMRHVFEEHGCKFMPFEEAIHFGKETELPEHKDIHTFLFHKNR